MNHEVLSYGVVAASTLLELADPFPEESGYAEVRGVHRSFGGEAAASAYVLARLGVPVRLAGTTLGYDEAAEWAIGRLSAAGVDCSGVPRAEGGGVPEFVVSSGAERTVLAGYGRMLAERDWAAPRRDLLEGCRMACLDPFFGEDSEQLARWCVEEGVPYVTIDTPPDSTVARHAEAIVVSGEYATRELGGGDRSALLDRFTASVPGLVVLTAGSQPILHRRGGGTAGVEAAVEVDVVDTTGAGDSFRAGLMYGLLQGEDDAGAVRTAAAVAAMVCMSAPGVLESPSADDLRAFTASDRRVSR